ncbi:glycosyltransferase [Pseudarthrobacter sp. J75]|uniref:glycosyltransferase n=1 Tax=Pseudarthrobacter sp. J75 TaxID=3116486 RepID=UPI002E81F9B4|nr:glycosyltransferase [Pseudarthrobacter sp. J75]MEE2528799.1 glycosyltransferase [Pseudarthrobacter sp. J75]
MKLHFAGFKDEVGSPVNEGLNALRYAESLGHEQPILFGYTPLARMNPFQGLLYKSFWNEGFAVTPVAKASNFDKLVALKEFASTVAVHLHWHSAVLAGASSRGEARSRLADFRDQIDSFKQSGGKLVWTVHNLLPHDAKFVDEEIELQAFIADSSDVVHTMSHSTVEAMNGLLTLDAKRILMAPHPSYLGGYEDYVSRHEARVTLGLREDETVYVILGALKPYKGLREFLAGFDEFAAQARPDHKLIIAGEPDGSAEVMEFVKLAKRHPQVLIDDRKIPASLVQYYMRAADFSVVPYLRSLNSGAALLGATFGLPVIASRQGSLTEVLGEEFAEFLPDDSPRGIASALMRAQRLRKPEANEAASTFAAQLAPSTVSTAFARSLRSRLLPAGTQTPANHAGTAFSASL